MSRRGFTLLEVLLVLGIIALVAGVALPRLGALDGLALGSAARRLADEIGAGRERAILGGSAMRLVLDVDAGRWQLGRPGTAPDALAPDAEGAPLPAGVRVVEVGVGGTPPARAGRVVLDLRPDGDALPARIELADARGRRLTIAVPAAGRRPIVRREGAL